MNSRRRTSSTTSGRSSSRVTTDRPLASPLESSEPDSALGYPKTDKSDETQRGGSGVSAVVDPVGDASHPGIEDVAALLGLYQVPASTRDELLDLVRRSEERGWWTRQPGLPQLWRSLIDFEAKATRVQNYEALVVPGLLQTAEYARAIIQGVAPAITEAELGNLVAARMARQAVLTRANAPQFFAVVDEGALRRPIGEPGVMHRQLHHLLVVAEQPHVMLRVVSLAAGAYAGLRGPFVILEFAEEPALVFVENHDTGLILEEEADLAAYRLALGTILNAALAPAATTELITQIAAELG